MGFRFERSSLIAWLAQAVQVNKQRPEGRLLGIHRQEPSGTPRVDQVAFQAPLSPRIRAGEIPSAAFCSHPGPGNAVVSGGLSAVVGW